MSYKKVSVSFGFKNAKTNKTALNQCFQQISHQNNETLAFIKADNSNIAKSQNFSPTHSDTLKTVELFKNRNSKEFKKSLLFSVNVSSFAANLNSFQSLFKEYLTNPELFYLFLANKRINAGLTFHLSPFTSHLSSPVLHSTLWVRLREGRGELWRLKRCRLIKWAFFKERPKPELVLVCPLRPPSSKLPLPLFIKKGELSPSTFNLNEPRDARYLPLPLTCWNYPNNLETPNRLIKENHAMILQNAAEFKINGETVNVLSCSLSTADSSYCWQVSLSIYHEDYLKLNLEDENKIEVKINNYDWLFLLEDVKLRRSFNSFTVELTGRSPSAALGADYAEVLNGFFPTELYARQIMDNLLEFSAFSIKSFDTEDYLIPANTLDLSDKSPLAVISALASASGGFVETDRLGYELKIKPRYPVKAWEVAETAANVSLPTSHITELATERLVKTYYNAVRVAGNTEGTLVYREGEDRKNEAPIVQSPLFTEFQQRRAKGIEILSDSGKHQSQEFKTLLGDALNLKEDSVPLAELGEIWEIRGEGIKGIIRGISLNLTLDNEALKVEQTLTLDEYINN